MTTLTYISILVATLLSMLDRTYIEVKFYKESMHEVHILGKNKCIKFHRGE